MSANLLRMPNARAERPQLNLPPPRVWKAEDLAQFLGLSVHWVYKKTERGSTNPIPRIKGTRLIRFDTHSPKFQAWLEWFLDDVDTEAGQ